jgi:dolichol-phosphate mannosyltransferase
MVAWLIRAGTALCGDTELGVRLGALFCGGIAAAFIYRLTRNLFDEASALVALVIMQALPFFFVSGILMTPDAPLTAAWAALLYFLERALLAGRASAWWWAGIALGLGMLSKYTIVMVVPAAFIFMVWDAQARRWLVHWLPYAALVLAALIFAPVIYWNATHEWASFAFQTSRRLAESPRFSLHKLILSVLVLLTPAGVVSLVTTLWGRPEQDSRRRHFMQLAVLMPLTVFFIFSLRHEVKLDWTGTLWLAAVPALAWSIVAGSNEVGGGRLRAWAGAAWPPTLVILVLIFGSVFHYLVLGLPGAAYSPHIELVPVGWRSLGAQVTAIDADVRAQIGAEPLVVGMDRYAIASELAFYSPDRMRSVNQTSSDNLFGGVGLMYERWFPAAAQAGRTLLLVGFKPEDLSAKAVDSRARRLGPIQEGVLSRDGRTIRRYYYRIAYDYRGAASDR